MRTINRIFLHHTASRMGTHTWEEIRQWHLKKGWADIGYHYGIVNDAGSFAVMIGRPVENIGAHVKGHNKDSIGVAFEGDFETNTLGREMYALGVALVSDLCWKFGVEPSNVLGHCEAPYATQCPGKWFPLNEMRGAIRDRLRWREES